MFSLNYASIKKFKDLTARLLKERCVYCLAGLGFLFLVLTVLIIYFYAWSAAEKATAPDQANEQTKTNIDLFEKIQQKMTTKEKSAQEGLGKNYPDIFR